MSNFKGKDRDSLFPPDETTPRKVWGYVTTDSYE